jgi:hypothetical protein
MAEPSVIARTITGEHGKSPFRGVLLIDQPVTTPFDFSDGGGSALRTHRAAPRLSAILRPAGSSEPAKAQPEFAISGTAVSLSSPSHCVSLTALRCLLREIDAFPIPPQMGRPVCPARCISVARAAIGMSIAVGNHPARRISSTRMFMKLLLLRDGAILDIRTRKTTAVRCGISTRGGWHTAKRRRVLNLRHSKITRCACRSIPLASSSRQDHLVVCIT